ncbi:MAG: OmpA family protein, partial [Saprospiraceae bacterium]|nr:OmpA family protein [Saprospiraceae bacterium]
VFFTRTNLKKGKPREGKDGKVRLKIYSAKFNTQSSKWEKIEELPFNSNDFDCMHPSVSADGQRLYFVSNRSGGKGGLDIYVSFLQNGKWGDPVNLGPAINTAKDEVFPFIHPDNSLYFATNGRKGLGGFDIFSTKKTEEGWLQPQLIPEPINSSSNDFGIIVSEDKKSGFFSSNRSSGQGDDDIFSFTESDNIDEAAAGSDKTDISMKIETIAKTGNTPPSVQTENDVKENEKGQQKTNNSEVETSENRVEATPQMSQQIAKKEMLTRVDVDIMAIDKVTNKPIKNVKVSVLNMKSIKNATFLTDATGKVTGLRAETGASIPLDILPSQDEITDQNGNITLSVNAGERFLFNFSKDGYDSKYVVKTVVNGDNKVAAFMTKPSKDKPVIVNSKGIVSKKDTIPSRNTDFEENKITFSDEEYNPENYSFELRNIYYGYGDAEVNEEAKTELDPLLKMMLKDKNIEIEIASHTDSKGKAPFNMTLSQLRADNIKTHFVESGIHPDRIRTFGYGETMLRNRCKDGVNCSEEEHAINRRTVIRVVKGIEIQPVTATVPPVKTYNTSVKTRHTEGGDFVASNTFNASNMTTSPTASTDKKHFHVVIGTFTKPENAQKLQRKAIDAGFVESDVIQDHMTFMYSVSVRLFTDQKEARKLADYINNQKEFEAFVKEWK